jgi:hypothetical protein
MSARPLRAPRLLSVRGARAEPGDGCCSACTIVCSSHDELSGGGDGHLDMLGEPAGYGVGRAFAFRVIQKRCRTSLARVWPEERRVWTEERLLKPQRRLDESGELRRLVLVVRFIVGSSSVVVFVVGRKDSTQTVPPRRSPFLVGGFFARLAGCLVENHPPSTRLQGLLIVRPCRVVEAVVDVAAVLQSVQGGATNTTAQAGGDGKQRPQDNNLATRGGSNGVMKCSVVIVDIGRFR